MTGSFLVPIIVPIVAIITLAAWLGMVYWADANPGWKARSVVRDPEPIDLRRPPRATARSEDRIQSMGGEVESSKGIPQVRPEGRGHPADHDAAELYNVAYAESQRTLDDQQDELKGMRDRAVAFTTFVGAATAFLVGTGLSVTHRDITFYTLAAVASALSAVWILLLIALLNPRKKKPWNYRLSAESLITGWIETEVPGPSKAQFLRALALTYDEMRTANEDLLGPLRTAYRWLIIVGSAQVTLWAALVWLKG